MKSLIDALDTLRGFKSYEKVTFVTFIMSATMALLDGQIYYALCILMGNLWIVTSSGYRQSVQKLLSILNKGV